MKHSKGLFQKDFILVVIGQIISLFGNSILRFALPLYLLNQTHSSILFGMVSACSFIPIILLSPIGGILADRVNKRNIMVILDFSTAFLILVLTILLGKMNLVILLLGALILLYGIQGTYQPAVQASIPALMSREELVPANAVINLVNSMAGLVGPVIGGAVFAFAGIRPILEISIVCFVISAVMEIFIHIPFHKIVTSRSIFVIAAQDMKESFKFIAEKKPVIGKGGVIIAAINLFFSALVIIGVPIIITEHLGFSEQLGNQLYGYAQGALAAGGLIGGLLAGVLGKKMQIQKAHKLLILACLSLFPIGIVLCLPVGAMCVYAVMVVCCFMMMITSSLFTIQLMAYVQMVTPSELIGKIMSMITCISVASQPLGQAMYGILFDVLEDRLYLIFFGAMVICLGIARYSGGLFGSIPEK